MQPHEQIAVTVRIYDEYNAQQWYQLEISQDGLIWIRNQDGEGMGMNTNQSFGYLDAWFRENM